MNNTWKIIWPNVANIARNKVLWEFRSRKDEFQFEAWKGFVDKKKQKRLAWTINKSQAVDRGYFYPFHHHTLGNPVGLPAHCNQDHHESYFYPPRRYFRGSRWEMANIAGRYLQHLYPTCRTKSGLAVEKGGTKSVVCTQCNCAKEHVH